MVIALPAYAPRTTNSGRAGGLDALHVARIELADRLAADPPEHDAQVAQEVVEDTADAGLAVDGQPEQARPTDEHGVGPERQRLHDVGARADAAVEEHRHVRADGGPNVGQRVERRAPAA